MSRPPFALRLRVEIRLASTDEGGRKGPIADGYRPLCVIEDAKLGRTVIGMCELELARELSPGDVGEGVLGFAAVVADLVKSVLSTGSIFTLAEGNHDVATATVLEYM
jgi:hypothetical protein